MSVAEGPRWERRIAVSGQAPNLLGELACDAALDSTKRNTSVAQIVQGMVTSVESGVLSRCDCGRWLRSLGRVLCEHGPIGAVDFEVD
jgi:hypothetical protein